LIETVIRNLQQDDGPIAAEIFFDAVRNGTNTYYSQREREAWSGPAPDPAHWTRLLTALGGYVAEVGREPVGFMTLSSTAVIDFAFVKSSAAGQGIGQRLYDHIEKTARTAQHQELQAQVSLAARPFFERNGWRVIKQERVERRGIPLTRFRMCKALDKRA